MASANPARLSTARTMMHRTAIGVFRRLPLKLRRNLVRLGTPNYTLGSVVLLRDHDDRLLLVRQPPATGWSLPGGLLDRREHPRDAAIREVREEIGVTLEPDAVTPIVPNAHVNPWVQQVDLIFTATVDANAVSLTVDEVEIGEARWFAVDALPPLTGPTFRLLGRAGLVSPEASPADPAPAALPDAPAVRTEPDAPVVRTEPDAPGVLSEPDALDTATQHDATGPTPGVGTAGTPTPTDALGTAASDDATGTATPASTAATGHEADLSATSARPDSDDAGSPTGAVGAGAESTLDPAAPATDDAASSRSDGMEGASAAHGALTAPTSATVVGAVLEGGADRTDAVLSEPGEAFADPEAPAPQTPVDAQRAGQAPPSHDGPEHDAAVPDTRGEETAPRTREGS